MKKLISLAIILISLGTGKMLAQGIAVRTNGAFDLLGYANIGVDLTLNDQTTVIFSAIGGKTYLPMLKKTFAVAGQIEARHWFSHQPYEDFFLGVQVMPTVYNMWRNTTHEVEIKDDQGVVIDTQMVRDEMQHNGFAFPVGFNFGYSWPINTKLNVEVSYGAGVIFYSEYWEGYDPPKGKIFGKEIDKNYFLNFSTTNISVAVTYILK